LAAKCVYIIKKSSSVFQRFADLRLADFFKFLLKIRLELAVNDRYYLNRDVIFRPVDKVIEFETHRTPNRTS